MKNTKALGNILANRLRVGASADTGASQIGTNNPPAPVEIPPVEGGIVIPISQLGNVVVGDTVTLTVKAINGNNVSLEKVEGMSKAAPIGLPSSASTVTY